MLKEALEFILNLKEPKIEEIYGDIYADKQLYRIDSYYPKAKPIQLNTLSSFMDYLEANIDDMNDWMIVEVESPTKVKLYSGLNENREREYLVEVNAMLPDFSFDTFLDHERFCINLQSKFLKNKDCSLVLQFAGTVEAGSVSEYGDDGITQKATVKTGIISKGEAIIPNPVKLIPYRTFLEVEQPASSFIFRMKEGAGGVQCAIFEADGGAWRMEAMQNVKSFLQERLEKLSKFIVIA